jgi:1-acyl-sn-glycerol-3-phosphate acyltransferase
VGARLVYREIDVVAFGQPPTGPVLVASNHFGGFADAMLLIAISDRFPCIVARDVIWRVPVVGRLMRGIGAIPVARRADDRGVRRSNGEMFAACYAAVADGDVALIFPEGVTQDDPFLAPVRTGAARITLGAKAQGVTGIGLVPVGIHYEDKAAFRSRVLVAVGEPIDLDAVDLPHGLDERPVGADDPAAVRALTELLDTRMRQVGPHYRDWDEARALTLAATVALHELTPSQSPDHRVPFGLVERLGAALAAVPDAARLPVQRAAAAYSADLTAPGAGRRCPGGTPPLRARALARGGPAAGRAGAVGGAGRAARGAARAARARHPAAACRSGRARVAPAAGRPGGGPAGPPARRARRHPARPPGRLGDPSMNLPVAWLAGAGGVAVVLAWTLTVIDIVRRPGLTRRARVAWATLVTVAVPTALLWLLARPTRAAVDVLADPLPAADPRARLVALAEGRSRGIVRDEQFRAALDEIWPQEAHP